MFLSKILHFCKNWYNTANIFYLKIIFIAAKTILWSVIAFSFWNTPAYTEETLKKINKVFQKCSTCHFLEKTENKIGPSLRNVINRKAGTYPGYRFSPAMVKAGKDGIIWNHKNLSDFLENPQKVVKGTRMASIKISNSQEIDAIINYIKELSD